MNSKKDVFKSSYEKEVSYPKASLSGRRTGKGKVRGKLKSRNKYKSKKVLPDNSQGQQEVTSCCDTNDNDFYFIKEPEEMIDWNKVEKLKDKGIPNIIASHLKTFCRMLERYDLIVDSVKNRNDVRTTKIIEFLGTKEIKSGDKSYGEYERYLACYAITYLIENVFGVKELFNIYQENIILPNYSEIQIDYDKDKSVLTDGTCFFEYEKTKYTMQIYICGGVYFINISVDVKDEHKIDKFFDLLDKIIKEHNFYIGKKLEVHANGFFVITKPTGKTWDNIVINDIIKKEIDDNIISMVNKSDIYKENNIPISRGIILEGSYGLGKTLLCQVLCDMVNCTVFCMSPKAMINSEVISYIYDTASEFAEDGITSIVIFEDMDLYGQDRDDGNRSTILGELMSQLNGIDDKTGIITIGTTNRIEIIEKALKDRPGRFDRILHFDLPSIEQRHEILERLIAKYFVKDLDIGKWAEQTNDFSGSHLADLVKTAVIQAVNREDYISSKSKKVKLSDLHFELAFDRINKVSMRKVGFRK